MKGSRSMSGFSPHDHTSMSPTMSSTTTTTIDAAGAGFSPGDATTTSASGEHVGYMPDTVIIV